MKRFCIILLIIIAAYIPCTSSYGAENQVKTQIFYRGNVYTLQETPLYYEGEYFLTASGLSSILDISIETDKSDYITLRYNGKSEVYNVKPDIAAIDKTKTVHNQPELLQGKLYIPFSFLKGAFKSTIKYNQSKNTIYIFEQDKDLSDFINISYGYHIALPDGVKPDSNESDNNFNESIMTFLNTSKNFSVAVACDRLDETALSNMRKYLDDYDSNNDVIFSKFVQYKGSYFDALQDYYKRNFLYGIEDDNCSESNMKVFGKYTENIFGQESSLCLYNTIDSERYSSDENTILSITIPISSKMEVYTINFKVKKGCLTKECISAINDFIMSLNIEGLDTQVSQINALSDLKAISAANDGIYPDIKDDSRMQYTTISNSDLGYEISYPSTYIPYKQNNIISCLDYKSFKINYNQYFSVSSEPIYDKGTALESKRKFMKGYIKGNAKSVEEGNINIGGKDFSYLKYELVEPQGSRFVEDYFTLGNSRLINLQLESRFILPSAAVHNQFLRILGSLSLSSPRNTVPLLESNFSKFINQDEGYSLIYPEGWQKTEDDTNDINYDSYTIKNPDFSGPLEVRISEGELSKDLDYASILRYITGSDLLSLNKYFNKYYAPYINRVNRPLDISVKVRGDAIYLYKLVNYMDSSSRGKYCYSVDIIRNKKIYSLFIIASDYMVADGKVINKDLASDLNLIASSFDIEDTPQHQRRNALGETRNSKVISVENFIKNNFDKNSKVKSIECLDSINHLLVTANCASHNTLYLIKADYAKNIIQVENRFQGKEVLTEASEKLKKQFMDKYIESIVTDETQMSIQIKYHDELYLPLIVRNYKVSGHLENGYFTWDTEREDYSIAIKNDCKEFLINYLSPNAKVYPGPDESFSNYQELKKQGKPFYTLVYAEFGKMSGYFLLKINSVNDSISLDSYTSTEQIYDKIDKLYSAPSNDYIVYNIGQDQSNKFEFQVFLKSKYTSEYKLYKVNVNLNSETLKLDVN